MHNFKDFVEAVFENKSQKNTKSKSLAASE